MVVVVVVVRWWWRRCRQYCVLMAVVEIVMVVVFGGVGVGVVVGSGKAVAGVVDAIGCGGFGGVVKKWRS